jgi:hypothetical protein
MVKLSSICRQQKYNNVYSDGVLLVSVVFLHRVTIKNFNLHSYSVVLLYKLCQTLRPSSH